MLQTLPLSFYIIIDLMLDSVSCNNMNQVVVYETIVWEMYEMGNIGDNIPLKLFLRLCDEIERIAPDVRSLYSGAELREIQRLAAKGELQRFVEEGPGGEVQPLFLFPGSPLIRRFVSCGIVSDLDMCQCILLFAAYPPEAVKRKMRTGKRKALQRERWVKKG